MAKSLRSSVKKANKSKLRARVFAPTENARTERLSAKLLELASQPKPAKKGMQPDEHDTKDNTEVAGQAEQQPEDMDLDNAHVTKPSSGSSKSKKSGRIHKKRHRKASNSITFSSLSKGGKSGLSRKGKR